MFSFFFVKIINYYITKTIIITIININIIMHKRPKNILAFQLQFNNCSFDERISSNCLTITIIINNGN